MNVHDLAGHGEVVKNPLQACSSVYSTDLILYRPGPLASELNVNVSFSKPLNSTVTIFPVTEYCTKI